MLGKKHNFSKKEVILRKWLEENCPISMREPINNPILEIKNLSKKTLFKNINFKLEDVDFRPAFVFDETVGKYLIFN